MLTGKAKGCFWELWTTSIWPEQRSHLIFNTVSRCCWSAHTRLIICGKRVVKICLAHIDAWSRTFLISWNNAVVPWSESQRALLLIQSTFMLTRLIHTLSLWWSSGFGKCKNAAELLLIITQNSLVLLRIRVPVPLLMNFGAVECRQQFGLFFQMQQKSPRRWAS